MDVPSNISWEVLVVDNNSTDSTRKTVESRIKKGSRYIRYIFEGIQGKSYALNTGLREAHGEIIAIIDDDIIVRKDWLSSLVNECKSDTKLGVLGGRVELFNNKDKPLTIRNSRTKTELIQSKFNPSYIPILGCNMAMKKEVFENVGLFDTQFGPGSKLNAIAEDVDFLYRASVKGYRIIYSPDVVVFHNHGRSTDSDVKAVTRGYLIGRGAFYRKYISSGDKRILKMACWEIYGTLKSAVENILSMRSIVEQWALIKLLVIGAMSYSNRKNENN
jgi:GT2 family glycosyltransferase